MHGLHTRPRAHLIGIAMAALMLLLAIGQTRADAGATRVVALEWDAVENLTVLGVTPVGAAELGEYDAFVPVARSRSIADVGSRTSPNLGTIRSLRPDLIVVPDYRLGSNLRALQAIAPVLVTRAYPGGSNAAQYDAMLRDFRAIARRVGKVAQGERIIGDLNSSIRSARRTLQRARRAGVRVTLTAPGGSFVAPGLRLFTGNSVPAEVMRRVGVQNGWTGSNAQFGYTTIPASDGVRTLRGVESGWVLFILHDRFRSVVTRFINSSDFQNLAFVRGNRLRVLPGTTWLYGGPRTTRLFVERLAGALTRTTR